MRMRFAGGSIIRVRYLSIYLFIYCLDIFYQEVDCERIFVVTVSNRLFTGVIVISASVSQPSNLVFRPYIPLFSATWQKMARSGGKT